MTTFHTDTPLRVPHDATTLDGFRRWAFSEDFPERGRITFIDGELIIDISPEASEPHNIVKGEVTSVLTQLTKRENLGKVYADGVLLTNEAANLSTEPDATFVTWGTLHSGRVVRAPGKREGTTQDLVGTPDWVLEVVSDSSVTKDNRVMRLKYHIAEIPEYWIIDARGDKIEFQLLRYTPDAYVPVEPDADGWRESSVFAHRFRLTRDHDQLGDWQYTLESAHVSLSGVSEMRSTGMLWRFATAMAASVYVLTLTACDQHDHEPARPKVPVAPEAAESHTVDEPTMSLWNQDVASLTTKLGSILGELEDDIRPGVTTQQIDDRVGDLIVSHKVTSSFRGNGGWPAYTTTSVNEEVINGLPSKRVLKAGDLLKLQVGVTNGTSYAMKSWTYAVGDISEADQRLMNAGIEALEAATAEAHLPNRVQSISRTLADHINAAGFTPSADYVGCRIGPTNRSPPKIPCFENEKLRADLDTGLVNGSVLYITSIVHAGKSDLLYGRNAVRSKDGSRSVCFSQMVIVGEQPTLLEDGPRKAKQ